MNSALAHRGVCCLQVGILERRCSHRMRSSLSRPMVVRHRLQQRRAERVVVRAESSGDDKQNTQLVRLFKSGCEDAQRNNVILHLL